MKTLITSQNSLLTIFRSRSASILVALTLGAFALASAPTAFGVVPAPDGGYPGANTAEGDAALFSLTTGTSNTAIGNNALFLDTTGSLNTATGANALVNNTTGSKNTGTGVNALAFNEIGSDNTATGFDALSGDGNTGSNNTADGSHALVNNNSGDDNTATGFQALGSNTTGSLNTANGVNALFNNTTGGNNTANGVAALFHNITGDNNTANGVDALASNGSGGNNTANGVNALFSNTTGNLNVGLGVDSLLRNTTGNFNTANGVAALQNNTTGGGNIALGFNAGGNLTIGNNNIDIGNVGVAAEANTVRVGTQGTHRRAFIAGISGTAITGSPVVANASGQLGVAASSERFKDEIKPMDKMSEAILALKPVAFRYKKDIDPQSVPQFGLVAEEVEKVNPDLVVRDKEGKPYSVRYDAVNAMLLNEFLKDHSTVQELKNEVAALTATVKEHASQIQKVSAKLEPSKPAPQIVLNKQ